jgi:sugar lactone lactonase YvrE
MRQRRTAANNSGRTRAISGALLLGALLVALPAGAQVASADFSLASPAAVAYDAAGNLYVADTNHNLVREVDINGQPSIIAGTGEQGFAGDGGPATQALFDTPTGIAISTSGALFIADSHNHRVRMIQNSVITTVAGNGIAGFSGDSAAATQASLALPSAVALDTAGNLYIADTNNHRIRKVSTSGIISTVAGDGEQFFSGDGGSALAAGLDSPSGVAIDSSGRILISDTHNQRVRAVNAQGSISTLAGNGNATFSGDGASATTASLARPMGLASDAAGNVYVADTNNQRVRMVTGNVITTFAGDGVQDFAGDGGPATSASLNELRGVMPAPSGDVAIADTGNNRVRIVSDGIINSAPRPGGTAALQLTGASTDVYGSGQVLATLQHDSNPPSTKLTIFDNGQSVALVPLSGATGIFNTAQLNAGSHQLVAVLPNPDGSPGLSSNIFPLSISAAATIATATAETVAYGAPIPPVTGTLTGVLQQDTGNVNAVFATPAISTSNAGTYPITVSLAGSAAPNYTVSLAPNSGSVTITQAGSTTGLNSPVNTVPQTVPVLFTAKVNSDTTGVPSGNVTFFDGSTAIGTVPMVNGSATLSASFVPVGTQAITAQYTGDTNFTSSTSPAIDVNNILAYSIKATPNSITIPPGKTVTVSVAINPATGFPGTIALSCANLPSMLHCSFATPSVDASAGAATVELKISADALAAAQLRKDTGAPALALAFWLPGLAFGTFGLRNRRLTGRARQTLFLLLLLVGLGGGAMMGCGSGRDLPTAIGTFHVQVTGTSGVLSQSSTVDILTQ